MVWKHGGNQQATQRLHVARGKAKTCNLWVACWLPEPVIGNPGVACPNARGQRGVGQRSYRWGSIAFLRVRTETMLNSAYWLASFPARRRRRGEGRRLLPARGGPAGLGREPGGSDPGHGARSRHPAPRRGHHRRPRSFRRHPALRALEEDLPAGRHTLVVRRGGRIVQQSPFTVEAGREVILTAWWPRAADPRAATRTPGP